MSLTKAKDDQKCKAQSWETVVSFEDEYGQSFDITAYGEHEYEARLNLDHEMYKLECKFKEWFKAARDENIVRLNQIRPPTLLELYNKREYGTPYNPTITNEEKSKV